MQAEWAMMKPCNARRHIKLGQLAIPFFNLHMPHQASGARSNALTIPGK